MSEISAKTSTYLSKHYKGKRFVFYLWVDYLVPAIRISIVSYYEKLELPFGCNLNKVDDLKEVISQFKNKALLNGISAERLLRESSDENEETANFILTVYSKIISC
ncbi:hypothetical protein CGZ75_05860 [Paenibacillus herberti]|uniref:Uncharacterized protein n=1 Tax=Paenibacillus herberti TaxID=1619309 RepID=A0A229P2B2_9BACL|nr:hypothetical protein CGZ75_05860 [Paenibacillus herberti]